MKLKKVIMVTAVSLYTGVTTFLACQEIDDKLKIYYTSTAQQESMTVEEVREANKCSPAFRKDNPDCDTAPPE
jgi:hypothetical protein